MTVRKKNDNSKAPKALSEGIHRINSLLQNVEDELNKTLKSARHQGKKSAQSLMKTMDGLVNNVKNPTALRKIAMQKSGILRREIKKFSGDVMHQLRDNLSNTVTKLQDSEFLEFAKVEMNDTREQVLSALQIPSNSELEQITRKLTILERKLNALKKHDARQ